MRRPPISWRYEIAVVDDFGGALDDAYDGDVGCQHTNPSREWVLITFILHLAQRKGAPDLALRQAVPCDDQCRAKEQPDVDEHWYFVVDFSNSGPCLLSYIAFATLYFRSRPKS